MITQMGLIGDRVNKKRRVVQLIQAHNEEEFIECSISHIYDKVDKIIVLEGAVKNRQGRTEDGHSTDSTRQIIESFHDKDNKIKKITINRPWHDLEEMKNMLLNLCVDGDIIIISDADEFYLPEDIDRIRFAFDKYPHISEIIPSFLHFYGNGNFVAKPGPEWNPQHQRIFIYRDGMKYNSHPVVTDKDGNCTYFTPAYQSFRGVPIDPIYIYHYGYARNNMDSVMRAKKEYYDLELSKHGSANLKFDEKVTNWFNGTEEVLVYDGPAHPLFPCESTEKYGTVVGKFSTDTFYANPRPGNIWLCSTKQSQPHMPYFNNEINI